MNEENLYSDRKASEQMGTSAEAEKPDDRNERASSGYFIMPDSDTEKISPPENNTDDMSSGSIFAPYGDDRGNEQIPQEPKPAVSWDDPQQELYREGTPQFRGEYYQTPPQGMNQQGGYQQMQQEPYQAASQGFGIASMIMGIISLVLCCSCINIPLAVTAIIFGILQLAKSGTAKGAAITGIVTSALSIVIFFISLISMLVSTDFKQDFEKGFENGLQDYYNNYDIPGFGNGGHNEHHDDTF